MEKTWTISIVGIIVALGGLGFIAIFFAIVGHFFHKNSKKKAEKNASAAKKAVPRGEERKAPSTYTEKAENVKISETDEVVAVISAAIASFEGEKMPKILSIRSVDNDRAPRNMWRFHNPQKIWRINKRK